MNAVSLARPEALVTLNSTRTLNPAAPTCGPSKVQCPVIDQGDGIDAGYASVKTTTPQAERYDSDLTGEIVILGRRLWQRKRKLKIFDEPMPQAVWDRYNDLIELLSTPLFRYLAKSKIKHRPISFKLRLLGEDELSNQPYIVIQCDQTIATKIRQFFRQEHIKSHWSPSDVDGSTPAFEILVCERPITTSSSSRLPWTQI